MYTKYAAQYAQVIKDNIYNAHFERPSTQSMVDSLYGLNVLDLGCGSGEYAEWILNQSVKKLTCIDISHEMIGMVQTRFPNQLIAYQHDLNLGLGKEANQSVDVILCPLVIHYLENLDAFSRNISCSQNWGIHCPFNTPSLC